MLKIQTKKEGAELTSIQYNDKEMLFQGAQVLDSNGNTFWKRQAPILFPIVGQLKNSKTKIEGKTYEMSQHGFARDMKFEEISKTENEHHYMLKYNEETLKKYPYKFELHVIYEIIKDTLIVTYKVKNIDEKSIYFGLGGHPAFDCNYSNGEYEIAFEEQENEIEFLKLKDGLIDTEKADNILEDNKIYLKENTFDNDAVIMKNIKSNKVVLQNHKTNKKILEFDFTGFPYLALWSKKGAPFVCIEPWQNTADRIDSTQIYKDKENIIKLEKNKEFECKYSIKF
ncbi:MAG: aldose 1-epimerase family protein [Clostridia bacterium]